MPHEFDGEIFEAKSDGCHNPHISYQTVGIQTHHSPHNQCWIPAVENTKMEIENSRNFTKCSSDKRQEWLVHGGFQSKYVSAGCTPTVRIGNQRSCNEISIRLQS